MFEEFWYMGFHIIIIAYFADIFKIFSRFYVIIVSFLAEQKMGYNAYLKLVVGYKIPGAQATKLADVRACSHTESQSKFCPECGKPMWVKEKRVILWDDDCGDNLALKGKFQVVSNNESNSVFFVGKVIKEDSLFNDDGKEMVVPGDEFPALYNSSFQKDLDSALAEIGIDGPYGKFGVHLSVYYSSWYDTPGNKLDSSSQKNAFLHGRAKRS